jgi:hypothetical protein
MTTTVPTEVRRALAREFSNVLRRWLSEREMVEVVERNERTGHKYGRSVCHSHDFCDANMAMAEAFANLGFKSCADIAEDDEREGPEWTAAADLWNEAWTMAKAADFNPEKI